MFYFFLQQKLTFHWQIQTWRRWSPLLDHASSGSSSSNKSNSRNNSTAADLKHLHFEAGNSFCLNASKNLQLIDNAGAHLLE